MPEFVTRFRILLEQGDINKAGNQLRNELQSIQREAAKAAQVPGASAATVAQQARTTLVARRAEAEVGLRGARDAGALDPAQYRRLQDELRRDFNAAFEALQAIHRGLEPIRRRDINAAARVLEQNRPPPAPVVSPVEEAANRALGAAARTTKTAGGVPDLVAARFPTEVELQDLVALFGPTGGLSQLLQRIHTMAPLVRRVGLQVAGASERGMAEAQAQADAGEGGADLRGLRANADLLRERRETDERIASEQLRLADADLITATNRLANVLNERAARELRARADAGDFGAADELALLRRDQKISAEERRRVAPETAGLDERQAALNEDRRQRATREQTAAIENRTQEEIDSAARLKVARTRNEAAVNSQARAMFNASLAPEERGSLFQRLQAGIASRQGGAPRAPLEFQRLGQFLGSRALTTAGFAASGALLYGGVNLITDMVGDAQKLQEELAVVRGSMQEIGQGDQFAGFRQGIIETARETGVLASDLAVVERRLLGIFEVQQRGANGEVTFQADPGRVNAEAGVAAEFASLSGLDLSTITDEMVSIRESFDEIKSAPGSMQAIADGVTAVGQRLGVTEEDLLNFTSRLGPLAAEAGLTARQVAQIGAVAIRSSGASADVLGENYGRVFSDIQNKTQQLVDFYQSIPVLASRATEVAEAAASGNLGRLIPMLLRDVQLLDDGQRLMLARTLAGTRQAQNFVSLFSQAPRLQAELATDPNADIGAFSERWEEHRKTVSFAVDQMRRAVEQLGDALFQAGLDDALVMAAHAGAELASVVGGMVRLFADFNDALGGIPVKLAAIALGLRALALLRGVGGAGLTRAGVNTNIGALAAQVAGLLSPYQGGQTLGPGAPAAQPLRPSLQNTSRLGQFGGRVFSGAAQGMASATGIGRSTGALGSALSGLAATVAPMVAAYTVTELAATISDQTAKVRQWTTDLDQIVADRIARGDAPERIQADIDALPSASVGEQIFAAVTRSKTAAQVAEDAFQKGTAPDVDRRLQVAIRELGAQAVAPGEYAYQDRTLEDLQAQLRKHPEDDFLRAMADRFLADAAGMDGVGQALADSDRDADQAEREARAATAAVDGATRRAASRRIGSDEALAAYQAGAGSLAAYVEAKKQEQIGFQALVANGGEAASQAAKDLADSQRAINDALNKGVTDSADIQRRIFEITGGTGSPAQVAASRRALIGGGAPQADIAAAKARLADPNLTDPGDRLTAAKEITDAQTEMFRRYVDGATSQADRLARITEGYTIDPAARAVLIDAALRVGANSDQIAAVATALGEDIDKVRAETVASILEFGQGEVQVHRKLLDARIAELQAARNDPAFRHDPGGRAAIDAQLQAALDARTGLGAIAVPDAATGTLPPGELQAEVSTARQDAEARLAVKRAQAQGDAVALAEIDRQAADILKRYAVTVADGLNAVAAGDQAASAARDAQIAIENARANVLEAQVSDDPLAVAQLAVTNTRRAEQQARGTANQLNAQAERIKAERGLQRVIFDIAQSQIDLAEAVANAGGEVVRAAELGLQGARDRLEDARRRGAGAADINRLEAGVVTAAANATSVARQDRIGDLDYLYEFDRITAQQFISSLQAELSLIPESNKEARREIERRIKALRDEMGQDLQFNLGEIRLPTMYEVGRYRQTQQAGVGYQDNRVVTVSMVNNNATDYQGAIDRFADALTAPARVSAAPKLYP